MSTNLVIDKYDRGMYDAAAKTFYAHSGFYNYGYWARGARTAEEACEHLVDRLLADVPDRTGRILDVACGMGGTTRHLLQSYRPANVTAVNISMKQIETARSNAPAGRFAAMDAVMLAFAESSFDTVLCVESAFHFRTRELFLREAHRVLKARGHLVLSDILFRPLLPRPLNSRRWIVENLVPDLDAYRETYERAGFTELTIVDATQDCWGAFYEKVTQFGLQQVRRRELPVRQFVVERVLLELTRLITRHYVLVSARKT